MEAEGQEKKPINVDLSAETADGTYSNLVAVAYSGSEFVLDFMKVLPGLPKPKVASRIIITPDNAKRLLYALGENLKDFEAQFGEIELNNKPINNIPMGFGSNNNAKA